MLVTKTMAETPGKPKCLNSGPVYCAISASAPKWSSSITPNETGMVILSSHQAVFMPLGRAEAMAWASRRRVVF